jgi:hypothetical protein
VVLAVADLAVPVIIALVMLAAILRGSGETCERAFRLLRWVTSRPEPPAPRREPAGADTSGNRQRGTSASGQ